MSFPMLTVSIAEANPGSAEFRVECMNFDPPSLKAKYCTFGMTKEKVISPSGEAFWDLGKYTRVDGFRSPDGQKRNPYYIPEGNVELIQKPVSTETMRKILEANKVPYSEFHSGNSHLSHAVVKVDKVEALSTEYNTKKNPAVHRERMLIIPENSNARVSLLNKDYRWVHYWARVPNRELKEKQKHYTEMFQASEKTLYLILRKYYYSQSTGEWIVGMHWL